jgi:hypothetical protein
VQIVCAMGSAYDAETDRCVRTYLVTSRDLRGIAEGEIRVFAKSIRKRRMNPEK